MISPDSEIPLIFTSPLPSMLISFLSLIHIYNVLVGRHTWGDNLSDPLSKHGDPASYREFKNTKLYGRYKPTSFLDMLNAMERYKDFYLMTDSKSTDTPTVQKEFSTLVQTAKKAGKTEYLDRLIVQIYNENMYYTIKKIYPFKHFVYTTSVSYTHLDVYKRQQTINQYSVHSFPFSNAIILACKAHTCLSYRIDCHI